MQQLFLISHYIIIFWSLSAVHVTYARHFIKYFLKFYKIVLNGLNVHDDFDFENFFSFPKKKTNEFIATCFFRPVKCLRFNSQQWYGTIFIVIIVSTSSRLHSCKYVNQKHDRIIISLFPYLPLFLSNSLTLCCWLIHSQLWLQTRDQHRPEH